MGYKTDIDRPVKKRERVQFVSRYTLNPIATKRMQVKLIEMCYVCRIKGNVVVRR